MWVGKYTEQLAALWFLFASRVQGFTKQRPLASRFEKQGG